MLGTSEILKNTWRCLNARLELILRTLNPPTHNCRHTPLLSQHIHPGSRGVPTGLLKCTGGVSLLSRKEVGLDLFFPSQMQENLKVRDVCVAVGAGRQGWVHGCKVWKPAQTWLGVLMYVHRSAHVDLDVCAHLPACGHVCGCAHTCDDVSACTHPCACVYACTYGARCAHQPACVGLHTHVRAPLPALVELCTHS